MLDASGIDPFDPVAGEIKIKLTDGSSFFVEQEPGEDEEGGGTFLVPRGRAPFLSNAVVGDQFFSAFRVTTISSNNGPDEPLPEETALVGVLTFLEVSRVVNLGGQPGSGNVFGQQIALADSSRFHETAGIDETTGLDTVGRFFLFQADLDGLNPNAGVFSGSAGGRPQDVRFTSGPDDPDHLVEDRFGKSFAADLIPNFADATMRLVATGSLVPDAVLDQVGEVDEVFQNLIVDGNAGISATGNIPGVRVRMDGGDWFGLGLLDDASLRETFLFYDGSVNEYEDLGGQVRGDPGVFSAGWEISSEDPIGFTVPDPAVLGDFVWHDLNADGIQDAGEPGIPDVPVQLQDVSGEVVAATTTDQDGMYRFAEVIPGKYRVVFDAPAGFMFSPANQGLDDVDSNADGAGRTALFTIDRGDQDLSVDVGLFRKVEIAGIVWDDLDADGIRAEGQGGGDLVTASTADGSGSQFLFNGINGGELDELEEPGVPGVLVTLEDNSGNVLAETTTDEGGSYAFSDLLPGSFKVVFELPEGFVEFTLPDQGEDDTVDSDVNSAGESQVVTLDSGQMELSLDAGLIRSSQVGDFVWNDLNANGIQDEGELGIRDVVVVLQDLSGNVLAATSTDAEGMYLFDDLSPGEYRLVFSAPAGFSFSPWNQGSDFIDSDADDDGATAVFQLDPGDRNLSLDAGLFGVSALGDLVWDDRNADGIRDAGEPGVSGVMVTLQDLSGNDLAMTTTNASGAYLFSDVVSGTYRLHFAAPAGFVFSPANQGADSVDSDADAAGTTAPFMLQPGDQNLSLDAGLFRTATLGDLVWDDLDADGIRDGGEPGVANVGVVLQGASGNELAATTTGSDGSYLFSGLVPGSFRVSFDLPDGFFGFTVPNQGGNDTVDSDADADGLTPFITLESGQQDLTFDAGLVRSASVGDFVWEDLDGDGMQDADEPGVPDVTVQLLDASGSTLATTTTDTAGLYGFSGIAPGSYGITFNAPAGFKFSPPNQGADSLDSDPDAAGLTAPFTLEPGEQDLTIDAGLFRVSSLGDLVWEDLNADGIRDEGEPGLPDIEVTLRDGSGNDLAVTVTDAAGAYFFNDLSPGSYQVVFRSPEGFQFSPSHQGDDDEVDSDADPDTGATQTLTLQSLSQDLTLDAGLFRPAEVGEFVWHDLNADGVQNEGEPGIEGVEVALLDEGGTVVATATTGSDGLYSISGITAGRYSVQFGGPAGFVFSEANQGDDAIDSDADASGRTDEFIVVSGDMIDRDAGLFRPARISGQKFEDLDGDGNRDSGEPAVGGFTIVLGQPDMIDTITTGSDGNYEFTGLKPGSYTVSEASQTGWVQSAPAAGTYEITLSSGDDVTGRDFGNFRPAEIRGRKFADLNENQASDEDEPGLAGFTIFLDDITVNGIPDPGEPFVTTDDQGAFAFTGLAPGEHRVAEVQQDDFIQTFPATGTHTLTLSSGQVAAGLDFGNVMIEPDLVVAIDSVALAAVFAPGDEASVSAVVTNAGRGTTEGEVTVEFYLSTDGVVGPDDFVLGSQTRLLSLGTGEGANFDMEDAIIRDDVFPNLYRVLARVTGDTDPEEIDTTNNTDVSDSTHQLVLFFGTFGGRKNVKLDFLGATYSLKRGGFGQIVAVNTFPDVNGSGDPQPVLTSHAPEIIQAVSIELHDTTKRSTARIKLPRRRISQIQDVDVDGPVRKLDFRDSDLFGDITVKNTASTIKVNQVHGPSLISIGNSKDKSGALSFFAEEVEDLSIKTGAEIRKIDVEAMASTDGVQDVIQSRRVKTFKSKGFVEGVDLLVSRELGSFTAAGMRRTNLLVGVDGDGVQLPGTAGDIVNRIGILGSVKLKGVRGSDVPTFADSRIVGASMRSIKLGTVSTANSGKTFGILANSIRRLRADGLPSLLPPAGPGQVIEGDFLVQLVV